MLALGPVYTRFSTTASDYFQAGAGILWLDVRSFRLGHDLFRLGVHRGRRAGLRKWHVLSPACGSQFLRVVFTFFFTAHRLRQMRGFTVVEAARNRFGAANQREDRFQISHSRPADKKLIDRLTNFDFP